MFGRTRYFGLVLAIAFAAFKGEGANGAEPSCSNCAEWNRPQQPFRVYGNTYYVGTHGLSSVLITSDQGHILIDGGLAESAPQIAANIRSLGFKVEDVRWILNSHPHHDHAGGIAELQRLTGAKVAMSPWPCDILLVPHPEFADVLSKLDRREKGSADAFIDKASCRTYATDMRLGFERRVAREKPPAP